MNKFNQVFQALLRSSILWGGLASVVFFALINGPLANAFLQRYTAGHPVEYVETIFFFIGLAVLAIKAVDVLVQYQVLGGLQLGSLRRGGQPLDDCEAMIARLDRLPERRQNDCLARRLRDALEHIRRCGSAQTLDDELKFLAEQEAARQYASYAFLRVIIWAIPILGFLGTVVGITLAIANLSPEALEKSLQEVTFGLGVAFDTTALALSLAMVLMFGQFLTERAETVLLAGVDQRAAAELVGRFQQLAPGSDGQLQATRRMAEIMIQAVEQLVRRQAELWQASIDAAHQRWSSLTDTAGRQWQTAMAGALAESLKAHAQQMAVIEQSAAEQNRRHWDQVQRALAQSIQTAAGLQDTLGKQGEILSRAIAAAGEVLSLEEALNRNLAALSGAKNFEQTVMSLAATIHLLNARLGQSPIDAPTVQLAPGRRTGQAA